MGKIKWRKNINNGYLLRELDLAPLTLGDKIFAMVLSAKIPGIIVDRNLNF